jgi:hypothetical protein
MGNKIDTNSNQAINTLKEMQKQLEKLRHDVSFREYVGFEMCMKIFFERYKKWIVVNNDSDNVCQVNS